MKKLMLSVVGMWFATSALADAAAKLTVIPDYNAQTFTVVLPSAPAKDLDLYCAYPGDKDQEQISTWHIVWAAKVPTGETQVTVPASALSLEDVLVRFVLADPDRACKEYAYIESNGDAAIITDVSATAKTCYELDFEFTKLQDDQRWLLCARDSAFSKNSICLAAIKAEENKLRIGYDMEKEVLVDASMLTTETKYRLAINSEHFLLTTASAVPSTLGDWTLDTTPEFTSSYRMGLGASASNGNLDAYPSCYPAYARYYSFKAWEYDGGELIADYRPLWDRETNKYGFYDVVSRRFYPSNLEADFTVDAATERPLDTFVSNLGELVMISDGVMVNPMVYVTSEEGYLEYQLNGLPEYGFCQIDVATGTREFTAPSEEFDYSDGENDFTVKVAGYRLDEFDNLTSTYVAGKVNRGKSSVSLSVADVASGVRLVWVWSVCPKRESLGFLNLLEADSLRLISGDTSAKASGCGYFDTGIHPNPRTTKVEFTAKLPSATNGPGNFFGVRSIDDDAHTFMLNQLENQLRLDTIVNKMVYYGVNDVIRFVLFNNSVILDNFTQPQFSGVYSGEVERANMELEDALPIFGQCKNGGQQYLSNIELEIYSFTVWTNETVLARNYLPCFDLESGCPCFYDTVTGTRCYQNSFADGAAKYDPVFADGKATIDEMVVVTAEPAEYMDIDADPYGAYRVAVGESKNFSGSQRMNFGMRVAGYRIDEYDAVQHAWIKGQVQKGKSVTLDGDTSVRRLVWIWQKTGLCIIVR